jgi:hypothetical protein
VQRDFVPLAPAATVAAAQKVRERKLAEFDTRIKALAAAEKGALTVAAAAAVGLSAEAKAVRKERDEFANRPLPFPTAYAVTEAQPGGKRKVGNACVQIKGDPDHPGREVPRRFLTVLGGQAIPAGAAGSGRRELADWVADPKNPLTARVMVNRIWQHHFGRGIVRTPANFGTLGERPTHPELLDHLASRFVEAGWSVKAMHRLVMLSRAYQMSSRDDAANARIDAANDYLWRFDRRRLDAESIRDALLAVGGNLDRSPGGPHPFPAPARWDFTQHNPFKAVYATDRRSVYLMTQRIQRHPFLALFDGPDTNAGTPARVTSTTPLQALYLMNDPFVHAQAKRFAARLLAEQSNDLARIERAYLLLYGRPPTDEELSAATQYLSRVREKLGERPGSSRPSAAAWESLTRALFLSNEFVYVD